MPKLQVSFFFYFLFICPLTVQKESKCRNNKKNIEKCNFFPVKAFEMVLFLYYFSAIYVRSQLFDLL